MKKHINQNREGGSWKKSSFGFRSSRGTHEVVQTLCLIIEGVINKNVDIQLAFSDLGKTFDNAMWNKLLKF